MPQLKRTARPAIRRVGCDGSRKPKPRKMSSAHRASAAYFAKNGGSDKNSERDSRPRTITALPNNAYSRRLLGPQKPGVEPVMRLISPLRLMRHKDGNETD